MASSSFRSLQHCRFSSSLKAHVGAAARFRITTNNKCTSAVRFSSSNAPQKLIRVPPNLKVDKRSTISPFYGMKRAGAAVEEKEELEEETPQSDTTERKEDEQLTAEEGDEEEDDYVEEDDEDEEFLYDPSSRAEAFLGRPVVPLPDRLYVSVVDKMDASEVGTLYLSEHVFGHDQIRIDLLQRAVEHHRACVRGKRKAITKTISEVSGSGRKVRNQKGSGRARAGHSRPAHWRGGAKAHGPKGSIQDYGARKLNKKVRKQALTHALSQKLKEGNLIVTNDWNLTSHKTKDLAGLLKAWNVGGRDGTSALILDHVEEETPKDEDEMPLSVGGLPVQLVVASGNMHSVQVLHQLRANVYSILKQEKLIMTVSAVQALEERLVPALT